MNSDTLVIIVISVLLGLPVYVFALSKLYSSLSAPSNPLPPVRPFSDHQQRRISEVELRAVKKELDLARKTIDQYINLVTTLYDELDTLHNGICNTCKARFVPGATSFSFRGHSSSSSSPISLWRRLFGGRLAQPQIHPVSRQTDLRSPETSTRLISSQTPSAAVDDIADSPESKPDEDDCSVVHNHEVKQTLDIHLAHTLKVKSGVNCVKFSREGNHLAVGLLSGATYIYDMKTFSYRILTRVEYPSKQQPPICAVQFSPDDKYIATGAHDGQIRIWNVAERRVISILKHLNTVGANAVSSVDFSPDGRFLLSCSWDGSVRIWCMRDGSSKKLLDREMAPVGSAAISPDGRYVAAGDYDHTLRIWDFRSGQLFQRWQAGGVLRSVVFTPDGKGLLSGGDDKTLKSWDISSLMYSRQSGSMRENLVSGIIDEHKECLSFHGHTDIINSVSIFPDGRWVVSASVDSTARIWDVRTGAWQCTVRQRIADFSATDASPDGRLLAIGSYDQSVRVWRYEQAG